MPGVRRGPLRGATCATCSRRASSPALRLLTLHNLAFVARLMRRLREAIPAGRLAQEAAAVRSGASF